MPPYRWTKFIRSRYFGDSETLWTTATSPGAALTIIQAEIDARNACLPDSAAIDGVRIADEGTLRNSILLVTQDSYWPAAERSLNIPPFGGVTDSTTTPFGEWRACLQQSIQYGANLKAQRYFAGVPRSLLVGEGYGLPYNSYPAFTTPYRAWAALVAGGNYYIKNYVPPNPILPYQVAGLAPNATPGGDIWVIFNVLATPTFVVGQKVWAQGFRPAKGTRSPTLNGIWYVSAVNPTFATNQIAISLRNSGAVVPALQRFTSHTYVFFKNPAYSAISYVRTVRNCIHKRGKSSLAPRGRRLTRASLDP